MTVLQSYRRPSSFTNPFVPLMQRSLPIGINSVEFTWSVAIFGRYDMFHVHWLEALVAGRGVLRSTVKKILAFALVVRLIITRVPVIQTVHNLKPHEAESIIEATLRRRISARTVAWILLNSRTKQPGRGRTYRVPHGHYREWLATIASQSPDAAREVAPGRLLFFGLIRGYKNVPTLIRAFKETAIPDMTLVVAGQPSTEALREQVMSLAAVDPRVTLHLKHVGDRDLYSQLAEAELVVLPYEEMHNSGAVLLALSLSRPVLVPKNAVNADLQREVGARWVLTYDHPLTSEQLAGAVNAIKSIERHGEPDLSRRDWKHIGQQLAACYLESYEGRIHA